MLLPPFATHGSSKTTWFAALSLGLLGFGGVAMIAYGIAGPDGR
jgi:hypothetical protein